MVNFRRICTALALVACALVSTFTHGAEMTNAQRTALRTAIFATPEAATLLAAGDVPGLRAWCNTATPSTRRWLSDAPVLPVEEAPSYLTYDTLTQGKRDSWLLFLHNPRDFGRAKVRQWVVDIWGNATANSNAEAVLLAGTAPATNAQVAIGGNTRTTGSVTALDATFEDEVDTLDATRLIFRDNGTIWTQ